MSEYPHCPLGVYEFRDSKPAFYDLDCARPKEVKVRFVNLARFDRQISILRVRGQMRLAASTVLIVGVGGASLLAQALAASGVGRLILVDPNVWEFHNKNRVIIPLDPIGWNKADALRLMIGEFFPDVNVDSYACRAMELPEEVYGQADVIVCGADRLNTRHYINRVALELRKPNSLSFGRCGALRIGLHRPRRCSGSRAGSHGVL
ncbi:MAG: ThiF family adenylyltransferase [Thermofilaceae archaeon]